MKKQEKKSLTQDPNRELRNSIRRLKWAILIELKPLTSRIEILLIRISVWLDQEVEKSKRIQNLGKIRKIRYWLILFFTSTGPCDLFSPKWWSQNMPSLYGEAFNKRDRNKDESRS